MPNNHELGRNMKRRSSMNFAISSSSAYFSPTPLSYVVSKLQSDHFCLEHIHEFEIVGITR